MLRPARQRASHRRRTGVNYDDVVVSRRRPVAEVANFIGFDTVADEAADSMADVEAGERRSG